MNALKTTLLLSILTLLFVFGGAALGGQSGMIAAFIFACLINLSAYWFSHKIVLGIYRAKPLSEKDAPQVFEIVRDLCQANGLHMPSIYIIPQDTPNAFATGRNPRKSVVAVTRGILRVLDKRELKGVLAHELAHVQNRDILISTIAATIAGAIAMIARIAQWGLIFGGGRSSNRNNPLGLIFTIALLIILPIAAVLIQLAISRSREFGADEGGAKYTKDPISLANALKKLQSQAQRRPLKANPATAHMFIVNPLSAKGFMKLFSTHPPLQNRIQRLEAMVGIR